jgi:hypothetical protein
MECLNSYPKDLLRNFLKAYLNKLVAGASRVLLEERLREALEKLFEELPKELQEWHHRPCRWLWAIASIRI